MSRGAKVIQAQGSIADAALRASHRRARIPIRTTDRRPNLRDMLHADGVIAHDANAELARYLRAR